jgi:hypothetical protein
MADGRGGYRRPSNPAPVSGPGALSRRTDGQQPTRQLSDAKYGEQKAYQEAQSAAPMNGDIGSMMGGGSAASAAGPDLSQIVPFGAASQRPDEPISAGMPGGLGGGPAMPTTAPTLTKETADRLRSYLPVLVALASRDDADPNTRQFVRQLRGELG